MFKKVILLTCISILFFSCKKENVIIKSVGPTYEEKLIAHKNSPHKKAMGWLLGMVSNWYINPERIPDSMDVVNFFGALPSKNIVAVASIKAAVRNLQLKRY